MTEYLLSRADGRDFLHFGRDTERVERGDQIGANTRGVSAADRVWSLRDEAEVPHGARGGKIGGGGRGAAWCRGLACVPHEQGADQDQRQQGDKAQAGRVMTRRGRHDQRLAAYVGRRGHAWQTPGTTAHYRGVTLNPAAKIATVARCAS